MGCLFSLFSRSQREEHSPEPAKQYSWDVRTKIDPKDFMVENLSNETVLKMPGSINGQQFIIQNCQGCTIFVLDHIATISIDDCSNCRIILGPVKTSIFVRDCVECKLLVACQQFRARDCRHIDVCLFSITQPIIESSTRMRFSCFQYHYPQLEEQFRQSGLSIFNNNWSNVHDFTPVQDEKNFSLLAPGGNLADYVPMPDSAAASVPVSLDPALSVIPLTHGLLHKPFDEVCFVAFFNDKQSHVRALTFIKQMRLLQAERSILVQSKEVQMQPEDAQRVFGSESYSSSIKHGPVIGLEYNGDDVCRLCHETLMQTTKELPGLVYISPNSTVAAQQIDAFYTVANMMMVI
jgi:protein XRP2